jgi:hypothetical protein
MLPIRCRFRVMMRAGGAADACAAGPTLLKRHVVVS